MIYAEYLSDKQGLLSTSLNGPVRHGTFGTIRLTYYLYYLPYPGYMYHPVNNTVETDYWLGLYRGRWDVREVIFIPAPDQYESSIPEGPYDPPMFLEDLPEEVIGSPWYIKYYGD